MGVVNRDVFRDNTNTLYFVEGAIIFFFVLKLVGALNLLVRKKKGKRI